jgi:hypothetical protein
MGDGLLGRHAEDDVAPKAAAGGPSPCRHAVEVGHPLLEVVCPFLWRRHSGVSQPLVSSSAGSAVCRRRGFIGAALELARLAPEPERHTWAALHSFQPRAHQPLPMTHSRPCFQRAPRRGWSRGTLSVRIASPSGYGRVRDRDRIRHDNHSGRFLILRGSAQPYGKAP